MQSPEWDGPFGPACKVVLLFLNGAASIGKGAGNGQISLLCSGKALDADIRTLALLANAGLIVRNAQQVILSQAGAELATSLRQRPDLDLRQLSDAGDEKAAVVLANPRESPLAGLQSGARSGGKAFLSQPEFDAGERLRSDFTRAMLMPRTSANWTASVSSGRRSGDANGMETLTTSALAARQRIDAALSGLGHDLSGVVADICCFLKGFEQVEMERKWPKRSAKFMLKAGLSVLALHYWPQPQPSSQSAAGVRLTTGRK